MGGTFIIDPQYRCVTFEGNFIQLCRKEFDILYFLMLHRRQVFSHEQLYEKVWKEDAILEIEKIVCYHIQGLQKKPRPYVNGVSYIKTIAGYGYRFNAGCS